MQAWHKAQKAKTIKKGKAANLKVRQERLAKRNPFRLQARIDELKGSTRPHDVKLVAELEMELTAVKKAREAAGIKDDEAKWRRNERNEGGRKDGRDEQKMRRDRLAGAGLGVGGREGDGEDSDSGESTSSSVADIPLPPGPLPPSSKKEPPKQEIKTTYESAPVLRDLRKEAAAFVPTAIKRKLAGQQQAQGEKKMRSGSEGAKSGQGPTPTSATAPSFPSMTINAAPAVDEEELRRFQVELEEVADNEA